jgi:hypothetical protein
MAKIMALADDTKNVGNNFFLYSPLYSSSSSMVCEKFENESHNGQCYKNFEIFSFLSSLNHHEFVALLEEIESEHAEINVSF